MSTTTIDVGDKHTWECVFRANDWTETVTTSTHRMRVPGGWIYRVTTETPKGIAEALAFVPEVAQ